MADLGVVEIMEFGGRFEHGGKVGTGQIHITYFSAFGALSLFDKIALMVFCISTEAIG